MLNTNQSQKKNVLKYAFILPALVGFMLLFQIETVAQVKESKSKIANYAVSTSYTSLVTKNTSDKELKELEKTFSGENHKLIISNVKRNKNNEIIAIKLVFDSGRTYVRVFERKSTEPITNIKIYVDKDNKDEKTFGFEDVNDATDFIVNENLSKQFGNEIKVKRENVSDEDYFPTPPTPPMPPDNPYTDMIDAPTPPDFPNIPDLPSDLEDKIAMAKYEKAMVSFEKKMKTIEPKMKEFEKKMEIFEKEMKLKEPDMKNFEIQMKVFEEKMKIFEIEMKEYQEKFEKK